MSDSRRVCSLMLSCAEFKLLCVNAYMPFEDDATNFDEFSRQLAIIDELIDCNPDCHIVLGGDFNVDFSHNGMHTDLLNDFCPVRNVKPIIRHPCNNIDFTYNFNMKSFSIIDHFILSDQLFNSSVKNKNVIHDVDNTSDHDPLFLELELAVAHYGFKSPKYETKPSWDKATSEHISEYKRLLRDNLHEIVLPFLGALAYADDIVLLAPTHRAMRNMLALCDKFGSDYHVVFNAKKSKCLYFNSRTNRSRISTTLPLFSVGGNDIEFVDE